MSKKLFRLIYLINCIPLQPYKVTSRQITEQLQRIDVSVSIRTIQRDLDVISSIDQLGIICDQRSKPHGWSRSPDVNQFMSNNNTMPMSLALALVTWRKYGSQLLPLSIIADLESICSSAEKILNADPLSKANFDNNNNLNQVFYLNTQEQLLKQQTVRSARWMKRLLKAEINFSINDRPVWEQCSRIMPLVMVDLAKEPLLICKIFDASKNIYAIPLSHIRGLMVSQENSRSTSVTMASCVLKNEGNCNHCQITCFYKGPDLIGKKAMFKI